MKVESKIAIQLLKNILLGAMAISSCAAIAASVDQDEWRRLNERATNGRYVPVVIDFANVSLVELNYQKEKVRGRGENLVAAVRNELGAELLTEGLNISDGGQLSGYVSQAGLARLRSSGSALSFREGAEWYSVSPLHRSAGELALVDAAATTAAGADVIVTLNIEGLQHTYSIDGNVSYSVDAQDRASRTASILGLADLVRTISGGKAARALQQAAVVQPSADKFDPTVRLALNRQELLAIATSNLVRDVRLTQSSPPPSFVSSPEALGMASKYGYADVIIALRPAVLQGNLSAKSTEAQLLSIAKTMDSVRTAHGGLQRTTNLTSAGAIIGRVSLEEILALTKSSDKRLASIGVNKSVMQPALMVSAPFLGLPLVWNTTGSNGFITGKGSAVVIMDTGVQVGHMAMRGPDGLSRVKYQACFQSTDLSRLSVCPGVQDISFNSYGSPAGDAFPFSSCPYSNPYYCAHGTMVAGAAAGQGFILTNAGSGAPVWLGKSGAYTADIWSYNIFSTARGSRNAQTMAFDLLEALNDVLNRTVPGTTANPVVINISSGLQTYSSVCTGSVVPAADQAVYSTVQTLVNNLYSRGIPVISSTGNGSDSNGSTFPACLAKVVKVGATPNDSLGTKTSTFSNLPDPSNFPGDFIWMVPGGGKAYNGANTTLTMPSSLDSSMLSRDQDGGTSFAAPQVAGIFALYKSTSPSASITEIGNYLNGIGRTYPVSGFSLTGTALRTYKGIRFTAL